MSLGHHLARFALAGAATLGATLALPPLVEAAPDDETAADAPAPANATAGDAPTAELAVVAPEQAEQQASVLAAEDRRIIEIQTIASLARWQGLNWTVPYRLGTGDGYTLVLTPRSEPYTVADLLELAPQTFLQMSDGGYILSEHLIVMPRAKLELTAPGGLQLRLASSPDGFATILSLGGKVTISGTSADPATVTSWDADAGAPDEELDDGRAYVRSIGGQFEASHAAFSHLGFWSGRTGGLALTGTDRPNTGAIETGVSPDDDAGSLLDDVTVQPAGPLADGQRNPTLDYSVDPVNYVSVLLEGVTVDGNAYGLFVSGANGVQVRDSAFRDNVFHGVVIHRYVVNAAIENSVAVRNGGDGFRIGRTANGVTITGATADDNATSGFSIDGRALAEGPSVVGAPLRAYGNNAITASTARDNGTFGIVVRGGFNIALHNNIVERHDMGIFVDGPAMSISVAGNQVRDTDRHGVAVVDGVTAATVTGNVVDDVRTGVYLRGSQGEVSGNTVTGATAHGVTLVGDVEGSAVTYNAVSGTGASAIDVHRSSGEITRQSNNVGGWTDTTPWYHWFRKLLQPMNLLWSTLFVLLVASAIRSRRTERVVAHPYHHQMAHRRPTVASAER